MTRHEHAQERFPLATLVLLASTRAIAQKARLLALAIAVSAERLDAHGIPVL